MGRGWLTLMGALAALLPGILAADEFAVSTGQVAAIVEEGQAGLDDAGMLYLFPGLRMVAIGGTPPVYTTEFGLRVRADPKRTVDGERLASLVRRLGPTLAILTEHVTSQLPTPAGERKVKLAPGELYRVLVRSRSSALLAVDVCDLLWSELPTCRDGDTPVLLQAIVVPARSIGIVELSGFMRGASAPSQALEPLRVTRRTGPSEPCQSSVIATAGPGGASSQAAARTIELTHARGGLRLDTAGICGAAADLQVVVRPQGGRSFELDPAFMKRIAVTADPGDGRVVIACPDQYWELFNALRAQRMGEVDAHLALAYLLRWRDQGETRCPDPAS